MYKLALQSKREPMLIYIPCRSYISLFRCFLFFFFVRACFSFFLVGGVVVVGRVGLRGYIPQNIPTVDSYSPNLLRTLQNIWETITIIKIKVQAQHRIVFATNIIYTWCRKKQSRWPLKQYAIKTFWLVGDWEDLGGPITTYYFSEHHHH